MNVNYCTLGCEIAVMMRVLGACGCSLGRMAHTAMLYELSNFFFFFGTFAS